MNELIKALAEQAAQESFDDVNDLSLEVSCEDQSYQVPSAFIARLSELIVRECVKESMEEIVAEEEIVQEEDPLIREYLKGNNQGIVDVVVRFRNHFGVEE